METLVVVSQGENQWYSEQKAYEHVKFRELICKAFQSEACLLPTPLKGFSISERASYSSSSSSSPGSPGANYESDESQLLRSSSKSSAKPINIKASNFERFYNEDISYFELWAGPAYSNSPPPSSLPIPKFSLSSKRTISLDLPDSDLDIELRPFAKSAPPSPTREPYFSPRDIFLSADSGTKTLRRVLNLEINDE